MIPRHIRKIKSFLAMDILEELGRLKAEGRSVISFSLGEPDLKPPHLVQRACIRALEEGFTKYTHSQGIPELRSEIAACYRRRYGVSVDPDQIIVTGGTSPAMLLTFSVLLSAGDNVILSNPHYPCYPAFIEFFRAKPNSVQVFEDDGFQYRSEVIRKKITRKTRALLINSPSNPTGNLMPERTLEEIASFTSRNLWIVSDEIYHGLVYEGRERSILEFTDRAFVINGFSKAYAMTGYRLGYVIAPKPFVRTLQILHQNFYISANSFVQRAGLEALREGEGFLRHARREYDKRRRLMLQGVRDLGFVVKVEPTGAFYIFADARRFDKKSERLASKILRATGVGITPGIDFGSGGEGYLRFSYATSQENIREGLKRLRNYLKHNERAG